LAVTPVFGRGAGQWFTDENTPATDGRIVRFVYSCLNQMSFVVKVGRYMGLYIVIGPIWLSASAQSRCFDAKLENH